MTKERLSVVIVGAGFAGIGLAIKLQQAGIDDVVLIERAEALGGTWRDNTYPGAACDVPSQLYSLSFAANAHWSRMYGQQAEILAYCRAVAADHDVERLIRYDTALESAEWDDDAAAWRITTSQGALEADVLILAVGPYGNAKMPDIPGIESFAGTAFHSLHWDHDHDLRGERVAVVGTGASAVQFVPEIAPDVARLFVYQRTAPWVMPRMDRRTHRFERALLARVPLLRRGVRAVHYALMEGFGLAIFVDRRVATVYESIGRSHLRRQVSDADLRRKLTPDYRIGCKRAVISDAYLPTLTRDNVELIDQAVAEIRPHAVVAADGTETEVDTIIFGTGFEMPPTIYGSIRGRDGRGILEIYRERPQSYLGLCYSGFPNLFSFLGPFGGAGNQSAIYMLESQMAYIVDAIRTMRTRDLLTVEVRSDAQEAFVRDVEQRSAKTVWEDGGCVSFFQTPEGRNAGLWPHWSFRYRLRTRAFDTNAFILVPR